MIRCVRLWTGDDAQSHFEEGAIDLRPGAGDDRVSAFLDTTRASFAETPAGGRLAWHTAPVRQLVITLSGTLEFETREAERFVIRPGDVLLAEDTTGRGHAWRSIDDEPWRRLYVVLAPDAPVPFVPVRPA